MKYIRTKDGIYENKPLEKHLGKRRGKGFEIVFKEQDIIKQADTIEELCDEFVFVSDKWKIEHRCYIDLNSAIILCKKDSVSITEIKGAIWCDKGLIYVAKMNDEGVLELL